MARRKSTESAGNVVQLRTDQASVQFWVPLQLREDFQRAVAGEERTMAQALRLHMAEVVARDGEAA